MPIRVHVGAITLLFAIFGGSTALAANDCRKTDYATERARVQQFLASNDFPRSEQVFLWKGIEQRVREMPPRFPKSSGDKCNIQEVHSLILGCLNETLPPALRSTLSPERKIGKTFWGKKDVSAREALVIGMFHACRAAAMEQFQK